MNYVEQVAKMLGVELNEEFYLDDSKEKYRITNSSYMCLQKFEEEEGVY